MPNYSKGKIYNIKFYDNDKLIYIGSTTQTLATRYTAHKSNFECSLYKYINNNYNGNWSNCYIELLEAYECNTKNELERREGELIKQFKADNNYIVINKIIPGRTYRESNIKKTDNFKEYNEYIKTKIMEWTDQYYLDNEYSEDIIKLGEKRKQYEIYFKANIDIWKKQLNYKNIC